MWHWIKIVVLLGFEPSKMFVGFSLLWIWVLWIVACLCVCFELCFCSFFFFFPLIYNFFETHFLWGLDFDFDFASFFFLVLECSFYANLIFILSLFLFINYLRCIFYVLVLDLDNVGFSLLWILEYFGLWHEFPFFLSFLFFDWFWVLDVLLHFFFLSFDV